MEKISKEIVSILYNSFISRIHPVPTKGSEKSKELQNKYHQDIYDFLVECYLNKLTDDELTFLHTYLKSDKGKSIRDAQEEINTELSQFISTIQKT